MQPREAYELLKSKGITLAVTDGNLRGPGGVPDEYRELIKAHKPGLVVLLTHPCPTCNRPTATLFDRRTYWAVECAINPAHYSEVFKKTTEQETLGLPAFESSET